MYVWTRHEVHDEHTLLSPQRRLIITDCCNLSGCVALIVWFTTNGMCVKNKNMCMWREQAIIVWSRWSDLGEWPLIMLVNLVNSWLCLLTVTTRVILSGDLYCCLLPQCEALNICRSGFPIATRHRGFSFCNGVVVGHKITDTFCDHHSCSLSGWRAFFIE